MENKEIIDNLNKKIKELELAIAKTNSTNKLIKLRIEKKELILKKLDLLINYEFLK